MLEYILSNKVYVVIVLLPTLSYMLYDFFQKGMAFEFWGNIVNKEDYHNEPISEKQGVLRTAMVSEPERVDELQKEIDRLQGEKIPTPWWKKPLGNCLKCFHVWVVIVFTIILTMCFNGLHWSSFLEINLLKWLLSLSLSYHFLIHNHYK